MSDDKPSFRTSRRRFVAGSAALAALGLVPGGLLAQSTAPSARLAPNTWLASLQRMPDGPTRLVSYGHGAEPVHPDRMMKVRLRGPWSLVPDSTLPNFELAAVYHACPEPFRLASSTTACHQLLHVNATALAALRIECNGVGSDCPLASPARPALLPGRHVMLIDPTGTRFRPDWAALRWDDEYGQLISERRQSLAALLVHVELA